MRPALGPAYRYSLILFLLLTVVTACEKQQVVTLVTEDFRFVPNLVRVSTETPLAISLFNAGRETHEFDSPILQYSAIRPTGSKPETPGVTVAPGKTVQFLVAPPAGTYVCICRRKGHGDMTGTLIVE